MSSGEVAIVGGGIVGLASALGAVEAGARVTLFDPHVGAGATYAAAGMLSPGAEFLGGFQPDYSAAARAFGLWSAFAEKLGVSVHRCETSIVGWSFGDRQDIARYVEVANRSGVSFVDTASTGFAMNPRAKVSAVFANEGFVDVDEVVAALRSKLLNDGVTIVGEAVLTVEPEVDKLMVRTPSTPQKFEKVVVATGASSSCLPLITATRVQPVRGVTIRVQLQAGPPAMLRGFIDGRTVYLVRRPSGVTVIGATSDFVSQPIVQTRDVYDLIALASQIVPEVQDAAFLDARAGLRPSSDDGVPFFECLTPKMAWTSGYFRHGVLMAPIATEYAREFVGDYRPI
jgi:glycine oxidase